MSDRQNNSEHGVNVGAAEEAISHAEALPTVIKDFVAHKIRYSKTWVEFYIALVNTRGDNTKLRSHLYAEITKFIQDRKVFPEYKKIADSKDFLDFLNKHENLINTIRDRALFEWRKIAQIHKTVIREIDNRYQISDPKHREQLTKLIQGQALEKLQERIKQGNFDDLVTSVLGEQIIKATNQKTIELTTVQNPLYEKVAHLLNTKERNDLEKALRTGTCAEENLRPLLEKLNPAECRTLLYTLKATISLDLLVLSWVMREDTARSMARKDLLSYQFLPAEQGDKELLTLIEKAIDDLVPNLDLSEYRISTESIDSHTIDTFVKTPKFSELIGYQLSLLVNEFNKSRSSPNVSTKTTARELTENILPKSIGIHSEFITYLAESVQQNKPAYIIQKVLWSDNQQHTVYLRVENWDDSNKSVDVYRLWANNKMLSSESKGNKDTVRYTEFAAELENSSHLTFLNKEAFDWRLEGVSKVSEESKPTHLETIFKALDTKAPVVTPAKSDPTRGWDALNENIKDPASPTKTPEPVTATGGGAGGNVPPVSPSTTTPDEPEQPRNPEQSENSDNEDESLNALSANLSLEQLLAKINEIDPDGAEHGLKVGTTLMTNDPGTGTTDFGILHIKEIREPQGNTPGLIILHDGLGEEIDMSFNAFYLAFKGKVATKNAVAKRITPIADASGFLSAIKSQHPDKWTFSEVEFDQETHRFIEKSRAEEKNYKGTRFFINDGYAVEIISHNGPNVTINFYTDVKSNDKKTKFEGDLVLDQKEISYEALATLFLRYNLTPSRYHRDGELPIKPIETQSVDQSKTTPGHVKHWFWKLSINDVLHGGKHFVDFLKEKIAHGSHLQEARVMLMLGRGIGLDKKNSDWFFDLKAKVENNEKKLVEERLEELGKMGGPDRQKSVYDSLMNNGSHDYEHWASVFSMLEKHGTLYVGADLRKLEWSYIFFKRVAGLPLGVDVAHSPIYKEMRAKLEKAQEPVTEEGIIREYMKAAAAGGKFNSLMWILARGKWAEGIRNEQESGKKEGDGFMTMDRRVDNAMSKFRENEYSKGIGAALSISDKPGSAARKHTPWVVLAISRKPERFHQDILQKFAGYYDEWRTHSPALMFLKDPASQEMFRQTIMALCEVNDLRNGITRANRNNASNRGKESMVEDFEAVLKKVNSRETFSKWGDNESFVSIEAFWKKYGETLQPQLTHSTRDPVTIYESANNAVFAAYNSKVNNELWNTNFSNIEMDLGTYLLNDATGASIVYSKTDKVLGKIKVNPNGISLHQGDKLSELFFGHFIETVKDIKKIQSTPAEAALVGKETAQYTLEKQFALYSKLHEEFYKFAIRETGQNYEKFWDGEPGKSYSPPFAVMHDLGFNSQGVKWSIYDLWKLKTLEYKNQVKKDFEKFLSIKHTDTSSKLIEKVRADTSKNSTSH